MIARGEIVEHSIHPQNVAILNGGAVYGASWSANHKDDFFARVVFFGSSHLVLRSRIPDFVNLLYPQ